MKVDNEELEKDILELKSSLNKKVNQFLTKHNQIDFRIKISVCSMESSNLKWAETRIKAYKVFYNNNEE